MTLLSETLRNEELHKSSAGLDAWLDVILIGHFQHTYLGPIDNTIDLV